MVVKTIIEMAAENKESKPVICCTIMMIRMWTAQRYSMVETICYSNYFVVHLRPSEELGTE